jgi:metal-responsive CopG/Arc/MetJ family transcriptional regulator
MSGTKTPARKSKWTPISIPTPLFEKIDKFIKGTGFPSVSSYATYVLREIVSDERDKSEPFSKEDEAKIRGRLRKLGYTE